MLKVMHSNETKTPIHLAILGSTKTGKTTTIASLTEAPDIILNCSKGDSNRTKVTIAYHFDIEADSAVTVEEVEFFQDKLMFTSLRSEERITKFNELMSGENGDLLKTLRFSKLAPGTDLTKHIEDVILSYKNTPVVENTSADEVTSMSEDELRRIITTEGIDKFIKRITLKVRPNEALSKVLLAKNADLFIRDTRGLLDIMVAEENGKKSINIPSLSDLGLENLDGVLFIASDNIPNIVQSLYKETLGNVLKSVPVFLISHCKMMAKEYNRIYRDINEKNISEFIRKIQDIDSPLEMYDDITTDYFQDTISLFESKDLGIMENGDFCDTFFPLNKVEFLIPTVRELKNPTYSTKEVLESTNFSFFSQVCTQSLCMMLDMINELFENMKKLSEQAAQQFLAAYNEDKKEKTLPNDVARYDYHRTSYMRPQLTYCGAEAIADKIIDPLYEPLGPRGGISTINNGKLKFPATAVSAVTAKQYISYLISNTVINDSICELFEGVNQTMLTKLLHKTLWCYLYCFIDANATIQSYLIINRFQVKDGIWYTRENYSGSSKQDVICDTIDNIVNLFAELVRTGKIGSKYILKHSDKGIM